MRLLLALLIVALLTGGLSACAGAGKGTGAGSKASGGGRANGDYRDNDDGRLPVDNDRISLSGYGHAATGAERSAIVALVKRYYAAAVAGDGARACTLLHSNIARAIPEDYGRLGPPYLRGGRTCAGVLVLLFKHYRRQLSSEVPHMKLTGVRLEGEEGFALLRFGKTPERQIALLREGSAWKIQAMIDEAMRRAP
jgi:hypothetical protein